MPDARPLGVNSLAMGLKEKDLANGLSAVFFSAVALRGVTSAKHSCVLSNDARAHESCASTSAALVQPMNLQFSCMARMLGCI